MKPDVLKTEVLIRTSIVWPILVIVVIDGRVRCVRTTTSLRDQLFRIMIIVGIYTATREPVQFHFAVSVQIP